MRAFALPDLIYRGQEIFHCPIIQVDFTPVVQCPATCFTLQEEAAQLSFGFQQLLSWPSCEHHLRMSVAGRRST